MSDELALLEKTHREMYAPKGLCLLHCMPNAQITQGTDSSPVDDSMIHLYFRPAESSQEDIIALVPVVHPFFVLKKGRFGQLIKLFMKLVNIFVLSLLVQLYSCNQLDLQ